MSKKMSLIIPGKERPNLLSLFKSYLTRKVKEDEEAWERRKNYFIGRHRHNPLVYDDYGDEYEEEMEQLRRFYGSCFGHGGSWEDDEDDEDVDYSNYDDYYVGDDGEIIFPNSGASQADPDRTLRPGEFRRSMVDMDDYWNKMSKYNEKGKCKHKKHRGKKAKVVDIDKPYNANYLSDDDNSGGMTTIYFYEDYHDKYNRIEFNNLYEFDEYCKEMGFTVPAYIAEQIAYAPINHCCLNPTAKDGGVLEILREETYGDMFYEACETSELSMT